MGKEKILKHIRQSAKNLPDCFDENGEKINHERILIRTYKREGAALVNDYIRQILINHRHHQLNQENANTI